jgi:hypothetical protein
MRYKDVGLNEYEATEDLAMVRHSLIEQVLEIEVLNDFRRFDR